MIKFDPHLFFNPVSKKISTPPPRLSTPPPKEKFRPPTSFWTIRTLVIGLLILTQPLRPLIKLEMTGFEPVASYMRSKRSTTELHPQLLPCVTPINRPIFISDAHGVRAYAERGHG